MPRKSLPAEPLSWPAGWDDLTVEQRRDDLLGRMLAMPPRVNASFVGQSVRIPRARGRQHDKTKLKGFKHTIPNDSLLMRIEQAVPPMRPEWREELVQDIALAIVAGELDERVLLDLEKMRRLRNKVIAKFSSKWAYVSLDQPLEYRDDKAALIDLLADGETYSLSDIQDLFHVPDE